MERLADRFRLIAPDLRGFGESDNPHPEPSDQVGADVHADDMLALMDACHWTARASSATTSAPM